MGLAQRCVPAPLSPPCHQPEWQNWSCTAELGFFRNRISLSPAVISASRWHNSWPIIAENRNQQLQEHAISNTYERDSCPFLPSVKWVFLRWYIRKACLILLPLCAPCTIIIPTLYTNITLRLHRNSFSVKCSICVWNTANMSWTLVGSLQGPSADLFFHQQHQPQQECSASQANSPYPCEADKKRTREEKL